MGENFPGGEITERAVSILADAADDDFDVFFGAAAPFDVGEASTGAFVGAFGGGFKGFEEVARGSEGGDGAFGEAFSVEDAGGFGHADEFDAGADEDGGAFFGLLGGAGEGKFGNAEGFGASGAAEFIGVVHPSEERVAVEEEATFEFVAVVAIGEDAAKFVELASHEVGEGAGVGGHEGGCVIGVVEDGAGGAECGKEGVHGCHEGGLPSGDADAGEVEIATFAGVGTDVVVALGEVRPERVVDVEGGAGDDVEAEVEEGAGSFGDAFLVLPFEEEGVFGESFGGVGVFVEHVGPERGAVALFGDIVEEGGEVVGVEGGFAVAGVVLAFFGAEGACAELGGFVSAEVDEFVVEGGQGVVNEGAAEALDVGVGGAGLEAFEEFFAVGFALFRVEEALHMAEEVDEGDEAEAGELAAEVGDGFGRDGGGAVRPGGAGVGKAVFEVEAESVVAGVKGFCAVPGEVIAGGGLFAGEVERPEAQRHGLSLRR